MVTIRTSILLLLVACTSIPSALSHSSYSQRELNEEKVVATNWQQHAPEYDALVYQSFNIARDNLTHLLNELPEGKRAAIVTDIDDTLINGTLYFSSMVGTDGVRNTDASVAWWQTQKMEALPGAVDFLNEVDRQGIDIFYVSARFNEAKQVSMTKMKQLGFPIKGPEYLLFQPTDNRTLSKEDQRQKIRNMGYHILMLLGDQLDDLAEVEGRHFTERQQWVQQNRSRFGKDWISFPNLVYGSWESAVVTDDFGQLSPQQKHDANQNALNHSYFDQILDPTFAQHNINAMLWMYSSADSHALANQAYNQATRMLEKLDQKVMENPVIVVNINGTILEYTPKPELCQSAPGSNYNGHSWRLEQQQYAKPIPGASEFLATARAKGFDIFYVDRSISYGRQCDRGNTEEQTVRKLRELGYPNADKTHVILKDEYHCPEAELNDCTKSFQRRAIASGLIDGKKHQVALYIGDSLSDFDLEENGYDPDLKESVAANKNRFGRQYMVIPNPIDTHRLTTLYNQYAGQPMDDLSSEEQANVRRKMIRDWPEKPF